MDHNEKRLRYDVLLTAIGIVDQDLYWRKENGEKITAPPTSAYTEKAAELLTFIEAGTQSSPKQLLNENQRRVVLTSTSDD
jgi:hypothetical protein